MNLWDAYLTYAWPIALCHLSLLIICIYSWGMERFHLVKEKKAFKQLADGDFYPIAETSTEISRLSIIALSMTRKGEILGPDLLRTRLAQRFAQYDLMVRTCLNGFVISGLLGTLYNLWKLGPNFWEGILSKQPNAGQPAIGIAFSASIFGLGSAFILMLFDAIVIRRSREQFVRKASNNLFDATAYIFPPQEGTAVAAALEKFYNTSTGFLMDLKSQHEDLSYKLIAQIHNSSGQLSDTLLRVSNSWDTLANSATSTISNLGGKLESEVNGLTQATQQAGHSLAAALRNLKELQEMESTLDNLRSDAASIQGKISAQMTDFNRQWQADLTSLSREHAERLGQAYIEGWKRFEKEATHWHQENVDTLKQFSEEVGKLITQGEGNQQKLGVYIDNLINSWRGELGRNTTGMQTGLAELRAETDRLAEATSRLSTSNDRAIQQLSELQQQIIAFSTNISSGSPVGSAMDTMTEAVRDFRSFMQNNNGSGSLTGTAPRNPSHEYDVNEPDELKQVIDLFGASLTRIEKHLGLIKDIASQSLEQMQQEKTVTAKTSWRGGWRKMVELIRRKKGA